MEEKGQVYVRERVLVGKWQAARAGRRVEVGARAELGSKQVARAERGSKQVGAGATHT